MASYPTFDPSVFVGGISTKKYRRIFVKKGTNVPQLNRAIQETKAVGSTFKAITSVAALEEGVVTPGSTFWCPGYYTSPNDHADPPQKFKCWALDGHGNLALIGAITQSCDVYFYNIGDIFFTRPGEALEDWAKRLGMGKPTGIDIPGEMPGRVPDAGVEEDVALLQDRDRPALEAERLDLSRRRPGQPGGDAAAARRQLRGDRQPRQGRHAAHRPQDHRCRRPHGP